MHEANIQRPNAACDRPAARGSFDAALEPPPAPGPTVSDDRGRLEQHVEQNVEQHESITPDAAFQARVAVPTTATPESIDDIVSRVTAKIRHAYGPLPHAQLDALVEDVVLDVVRFAAHWVDGPVPAAVRASAAGGPRSPDEWPPERRRAGRRHAEHHSPSE